MKKLTEAAAAAASNNEENVKPTLTVVSGNEQETKNTGDQNSEQARQNAEMKPQEKEVTAIPFEKRKEAVETLHRKNVNLSRVKEDFLKLDDFEIELKEAPDNTEAEYFNGCTFKISDDRGNSYAAKNPTLVAACLSLLKEKFQAKIVELEKEIVWPY